MVAGTDTDLADALGDWGSATIDGSEVNGIYDSEFVEVNDTETSMPTFFCRTPDVSSVVHGSTVIISGTTYKVSGIQPDGQGLTTLYLQAQ